jgi:hypothetical protein
VHWNEDPGSDSRRQRRGLAPVQVADDARPLATNVPAIGRKQRDVDPEWQELLDEPSPGDGVSGVVDGHSRKDENKAHEWRLAIRAEPIASRIRVTYLDSVPGMDNMEDNAAKVDPIARLHPVHACPGVSGFDEWSKGFRDDNDKVREPIEKGRQRGEIEVVTVLVSREQPADVVWETGDRRRGSNPECMLGQPWIHKNAQAAPRQHETSLAEPPDGHLTVVPTRRETHFHATSLGRTVSSMRSIEAGRRP